MAWLAATGLMVQYRKSYLYECSLRRHDSLRHDSFKSAHRYIVCMVKRPVLRLNQTIVIYRGGGISFVTLLSKHEEA